MQVDDAEFNLLAVGSDEMTVLRVLNSTDRGWPLYIVIIAKKAQQGSKIDTIKKMVISTDE